ncbi:hypothetical protein [Xiashengella succiniciproducens]|uniref:Uncharacterized protein n=1 Tax=Xiashengella succiniciproducens TaxID=2949635 RepID=A0A9J6ZSJ8_9BACT|nr:hypothetical protein [Alkaliflexus sp. Ai-910]URW80629.1 hypothetical protein M9189_04600 [Alkaliflexus sp. Ai-910]
MYKSLNIGINKKSERPVSSKKQNAIEPLLLNYRDPFLSKKDQPSITTPKNFTTSHSQIKKIEENNVHFRYLGMFSYGNQKRYIIEINGAQHVIEQGDCINNHCRPIKTDFDSSLLLTGLLSVVSFYNFSIFKSKPP